MPRVPLVLLVALTAIRAIVAVETSSAAAPASPATPADPAKPRAISATVAAQLNAAAPKYTPPAASATPAEPLPDLRETDRPRNTIPRLPPQFVHQRKPVILQEREIRTPKATLALALKRFPGLRFNPLFFLGSNDGIALAMLHEEERLENRRDMNEMLGLLRYSNPEKFKAMKDKVDGTFYRPSGP